MARIRRIGADIRFSRPIRAQGLIEPPAAAYRAEDPFMQLAIDEARMGIHNGEGGPFGCVIVKDGAVVGRGHNRVLAKNDSTWHGEIAAIREAEKNLSTHDLTGCVLYTTGEPCMMCLAACLWAKIAHIYYGCSITDNSSIGFRDGEMDELLVNRENVRGLLTRLDREACLELFDEFRSIGGIEY